MERVIQLAASFPNESKAANDISDTLIKNLWDNLRHPPISYLGYESRYRAADGAGNVGYFNSFSGQSGPFLWGFVSVALDPDFVTQFSRETWNVTWSNGGELIALEKDG